MGAAQVKEWVDGKRSRKHMELHTGHRSAIVWLTGLSGAGKTTVAQAVDEQLHWMGYRTFVLDGENICRIGEVAKLFMETGLIVLVAFISPFQKDRDQARNMTGAGEFFEVYCRCPVWVCERRDPKGLYLRARAGDIKDFAGVSSPYEEPENADLVLETDRKSVEECVQSVGDMMRINGIVRHEWTTV